MDENIYWTTDLGLAATLMLDFSLEAMDISNPSKVAFGFLRSENLQNYLQKYWDRKLAVEPQKFYSQLLMLRKRINQELNN